MDKGRKVYGYNACLADWRCCAGISVLERISYVNRQIVLWQLFVVFIVRLRACLLDARYAAGFDEEALTPSFFPAVML